MVNEIARFHGSHLARWPARLKVPIFDRPLRAAQAPDGAVTVDREGGLGAREIVIILFIRDATHGARYAPSGDLGEWNALWWRPAIETVVE